MERCTIEKKTKVINLKESGKFMSHSKNYSNHQKTNYLEKSIIVPTKELWPSIRWTLLGTSQVWGTFTCISLFTSLKSTKMQIFSSSKITDSNWGTGIPTPVSLTQDSMLSPTNHTAVLNTPTLERVHSVTPGINPGFFTCQLKALAQDTFLKKCKQYFLLKYNWLTILC